MLAPVEFFSKNSYVSWIMRSSQRRGFAHKDEFRFAYSSANTLVDVKLRLSNATHFCVSFQAFIHTDWMNPQKRRQKKDLFRKKALEFLFHNSSCRRLVCGRLVCSSVVFKLLCYLLDVSFLYINKVFLIYKIAQTR